MEAFRIVTNKKTTNAVSGCDMSLTVVLLDLRVRHSAWGDGNELGAGRASVTPKINVYRYNVPGGKHVGHQHTTTKDGAGQAVSEHCMKRCDRRHPFQSWPRCIGWGVPDKKTCLTSLPLELERDVHDKVADLEPLCSARKTREGVLPPCSSFRTPLD